MARDNLVRLSDKEKKLLEEVRKIKFKSNSVPLGETIEIVCRNYLEDTKIDTNHFNDNG